MQDSPSSRRLVKDDFLARAADLGIILQFTHIRVGIRQRPHFTPMNHLAISVSPARGGDDAMHSRNEYTIY
jgi:hypothetical protein